MSIDACNVEDINIPNITECFSLSFVAQPKQLHLTLDANLTVQTRRRYVSSMPSSIEELRKKNWLLAKMRQPNRPMFADLEVSGEMVGPDWNHCLEYEFQLRKKTLRLVKDQGVSIQRALKYRITHLTVANSRSQSSRWSLFAASARSPRGQRAQKQPLALKDKPALVKVAARARATPNEARV